MSDQLTQAYARAAEARNAIANIVDAVRSGDVDLAGAFERGDADVLTGRIFAVKVFEAVPGIGKVRARRTMDAIGIAEDCWLANVTAPQRDAIHAAFAES